MMPLPSDTREIIGAFAERVENRSLLFEKMVLPKSWGHPGKFDDATRFNVLRAAKDGRELLQEQKSDADYKTQSHNALPHVKEQNRHKSQVAGALAKVAVTQPPLEQARINSTLNLLNHIEVAYPGKSSTFVASLGGRLLINLAGGVQENAGLALDRCFGLPFIPGTAVKGITRHAALWDLRFESDEAKRLDKLVHALAIFGFVAGDLKNSAKDANFAWAVHHHAELLNQARHRLPAGDAMKGIVSFLPASPSSLEQLAIVAEGITPHTNPKTGGEESPTVLTFPAVERGARFGFALAATREVPGLETSSLLAQATAWLKTALMENGVGAKTSNGYGWFEIHPAHEEQRRKQQDALARRDSAAREATAKKAIELRAEADQAAEAEVRRAHLAKSDPITLIAEDISKLGEGPFNEKAKQIASLVADEQTAFFRVLLSSEKKERRKQWKKNKHDLWAQLVAAAKSLNIEFPA